PFPGPDPMMRYAAALRGERTPAPGLHPGLGSIIDDGCLVADPRQRLDAAGVAARLRAFGAEAARSGQSAQPSSSPPSETHRSSGPTPSATTRFEPQSSPTTPSEPQSSPTTP